jgi:subfamily B ATP-binding cassette protein MsbA
MQTRRLLAFLRPYRGKLVLAALLSLLAAAGTGAYAFLAGPAVRALVQGDLGAFDLGPMVGSVIPASVAEFLARSVLGALPLLIVLAALVKGVASAGANALLPGAVAAGAADLRAVLYRRLLRADPAFYQGHSTGDLVSRASNDVGAIEGEASVVVTSLVRDVTQALSLVAVCWAIDPRLAIGAAVLVPGTIVPVKKFADKLRGIGKEQLAGQAELLRRAEQMIQGHRIVQAYGAEDRERARFAATGERFLGVMRRSLFWRSAYSPTIEVLGVAAMAAVVWYAGHAVAAGRMPPEAVISFAAAALLLYQPMKAIGQLGQHLGHLAAASNRVFELIDAPDAIADSPGARDLPPPREIRLEDVTVRYGEKTVLDRVSLTFRAGETVALVGESGAGKSTVASLLLRFLDPTEGAVRFDGVDLREGTLRSIRGAVGYVPQESTVFADTVRGNIACGAAVPEEDLVRAAEEAHAWEWIARREGGLDAPLGETGGNLSGGERQRLGIARALARNARVLVLDEATSALDAENDALLQEAFARALAGDRIGVVISHRLASMRGVDRVVVLDRGRVVEEGRPEELLRAGGRFQALFGDQAVG